VDQVGPLEEVGDGLVQLLECDRLEWVARDHDDIPARGDGGSVLADDFAEATFDAVADDGLANAFANGEAVATMVKAVGCGAEDDPGAGPGAAFAADALEVGVLAETGRTVHKGDE